MSETKALAASASQTTVDGSLKVSFTVSCPRLHKNRATAETSTHRAVTAAQKTRLMRSRRRYSPDW
jgi:hypothetical protein